jgi:outer membrane protein assembly factor BamB
MIVVEGGFPRAVVAGWLLLLVGPPLGCGKAGEPPSLAPVGAEQPPAGAARRAGQAAEQADNGQRRPVDGVPPSGPSSPSAIPSPQPPDGLIASPEPDWPQWRGPRRDGISAETGLLAEWPAQGPPLVWKMGGLGQGWSSPIIVGDRLYITGDVEEQLQILALDGRGRQVWQAANGRAWTGSFPGARATCAFSGGRLYHMNAYGRVACLDAADGRELWAVDALKRFQAANITWAMSECLLVDGDRLIVTPGGREALVAAIDKRDGHTVWTTPSTGDAASYCSPILFRHAGRRLLASCASKHGFGVDADSGKLLWSVPLKNPYDVNVSSPVYGAGRVFYVTAYFPAACYRLAPQDDGVAAEKLWTNALDTVTGGAVLVGGELFAARYGRPKSWFSIDWGTGETRYELQDLTTGAAVYARRHLYCLAQDGRVALVETGHGGFHVGGRFRLPGVRGDDAWAHPVLLRGRLYLRYHDTLWCYDVSAAKRPDGPGGTAGR